MMVTGRLGQLLIVCLVLTACSPVRTGVTRYGDDLVEAVRGLTGRSADDANKLLDDATRLGPIADEAKVVAWSERIGRMADDLPASWFQEPDDLTRARSFVVGTACDAFEQLGNNELVTEADVRTLVEQNWGKSGLPAFIGHTLFVGNLTRALQAALADGDLTSAYPEVARLALCEAAG